MRKFFKKQGNEVVTLPPPPNKKEKRGKKIYFRKIVFVSTTTYYYIKIITRDAPTSRSVFRFHLLGDIKINDLCHEGTCGRKNFHNERNIPDGKK